ncbi:MAG: hypothetical protein QW666_03105 [Candidatus Woesearchaeota archaeon]
MGEKDSASQPIFSSEKFTLKNNRPSEEIRSLLKVILSNKEIEEVFHNVENNDAEIQKKYTNRLLKLTEVLNKKQTDLGYYVAQDIESRRLKNLNDTAALGIVDYIIAAAEKFSSEYIVHIKKIPEIIESIHGINGIDSHALRDAFIKEVLPEVTLKEIEDAAARYTREYNTSNPQLDEDTEKAIKAFEEIYGGNEELMKADVQKSLRETIDERVAKNIKRYIIVKNWLNNRGKK